MFCRRNIYLLIKIFSLVFLLLIVFNFLSIGRKKKELSVEQRPTKDVLQLYNLHFRSPAEENQVEKEPLNWVDMSISTYPEEVCGIADVVFVIHSRSKNFKHRFFLRNQFSDAGMPKFSGQHFFVVAVGNASKKLLEEVRLEAEKYKDLLVIENIEDNYHTISYKVRAWISFLAQRCSSKSPVRYIVKIDDDVMMSMPALLHILPSFNHYKNVVLCRTFLNGQLTRNTQSKWYLAKEEYKHSSLGMYCQGMAYIFSRRIVRRMASNIDKVQYLWMDDWYATHGLMNGTEAAYFDIGAHYISTNTRDETNQLLKKTKWKYQPIFGHFRPNYSLEETIMVWTAIQKQYKGYAYIVGQKS